MKIVATKMNYKVLEQIIEDVELLNYLFSNKKVSKFKLEVLKDLYQNIKKLGLCCE